MGVIWAEQCSNQSCKLPYYSTENSQIRFVGQARSHETIWKQETPEGCSPQKGGDGLSGSWKNSEEGGTLVGEVERATIQGRPDIWDSFRSSWVADQLIHREQFIINHWSTTLMTPDSKFKFCSTWSSMFLLPFELFVGGEDPDQGPNLCLNISALAESSQNASYMPSILAHMNFLRSLYYALSISMTVNLSYIYLHKDSLHFSVKCGPFLLENIPEMPSWPSLLWEHEALCFTDVQRQPKHCTHTWLYLTHLSLAISPCNLQTSLAILKCSPWNIEICKPDLHSI